jgi:hypothetical protein
MEPTQVYYLGEPLVLPLNIKVGSQVSKGAASLGQNAFRSTRC